LEHAMGRPPIGPRAMTEAERKRRQRAGLASKRARPFRDNGPVPKPAEPATKPSPADAAKDQQEIAELKGRIAELEAAQAVNHNPTKLGARLHATVMDEVRERIDEIVLPHWKEKIEKAQELYSRRRGLMNKETFNAIRRALHPDSRQSISDKKL